jgi:cysteine-rich repeat protein
MLSEGTSTMTQRIRSRSTIAFPLAVIVVAIAGCPSINVYGTGGDGATTTSSGGGGTTTSTSSGGGGSGGGTGSNSGAGGSGGPTGSPGGGGSTSSSGGGGSGGGSVPVCDTVFGAPIQVTVGSDPRSTAIADFNDDGWPDIAVVIGGDRVVGVLFNEGNGTFAPAVEYQYPDGALLAWVTAADLDGDGDPDLAIADQGSGPNSSVRVLLNIGGGTFEGAGQYVVDTTTLHVVAADLNGDGKLDLAASSFDKSTVSVLLNQGNGTFMTGVKYGVGTLPYALTAADLNGDGKADLATANRNSHNVSVLFGNGDGTFGAQKVFGVVSNPQAIAAADLNGDGRADLAVANSVASDAVSVLLGAGNDDFLPAVSYQSGSAPKSVIAVDLNGDGRLDLAVANLNGADVTVLLNEGTSPAALAFAAGAHFQAGTHPFSVTAGDLNSDGRPDLVVGNALPDSNAVSILFGLCPTGCGDGVTSNDEECDDGNLAPGDGCRGNCTTEKCGDGIVDPNMVCYLDPLINQVPTHPYGWYFDLGDMNGDGRLDFVTSARSGEPLVFLGAPTPGTFSEPPIVGPASTIAFSLGYDWQPPLAVGHFDDDTLLDIAAITTAPSYKTHLFLGKGDGTVEAPLFLADSPDMRCVAVANVNGDTRDDIIEAGSGGIAALLSAAGDTFSPPAATPGNAAYFVYTADVDKDGDIDILTLDQGNQSINCYLNGGNGVFAAPKPSAITPQVAAAPYRLTIGDLDDDGFPDLFINHFGGTTQHLMKGNGNGTFTNKSTLEVAGSSANGTIADIDNDGKRDLVVLTNDAKIVWFKGSGVGGLGAQQELGTLGAATGVDVQAADLNHDGSPDFVSAAPDGLTIRVLLSNP